MSAAAYLREAAENGTPVRPGVLRDLAILVEEAQEREAEGGDPDLQALLLWLDATVTGKPAPAWAVQTVGGLYWKHGQAQDARALSRGGA